MTCPQCAAESVRLSKAHNALEKVFKFLIPLSYYRCKKCGYRGKRVEFHGRRTEKWASRLVNAIGVVLLITLLAGIAALFVLDRATDVGLGR